ncbi:MAG TPA: site-2 protease family protein [Rhodothermales bacterium]|nr:site-2 protease family protein [Rhodothermales bacterium]
MEPREEIYERPTAQRPVLSGYQPPRKPKDRYVLHLVLFLATLLSVVWTGGTLVGRIVAYEHTPVWFTLGSGEGALPISVGLILDGLRYGLSLLLFLTVHEFGHYFAARIDGVSTSLPYYIPAPIFFVGTMGAVIRIREPIPSTRKLFDIGAAGPLAGFVIALVLLLYALFTLPPPQYVFGLGEHVLLKEFVQAHGRFPDTMPPVNPAGGGVEIVIGQTLLYQVLSQFFANVPPMYEIYHYPVLFAAWLGLFFTALNLLPVGQLDGGHVTYALFGQKWHRRLARGFMVFILTSGAIGFLEEAVPLLYATNVWLGRLSWFILAGILYLYLFRTFDGNNHVIAPVLLGMMLVAALAKWIGPAAMQFGYFGWLVFGLLLVAFVRVDHPPVLYTEPLTPGRRALGYLCILIFVLCFSIRPFYIVA